MRAGHTAVRVVSVTDHGQRIDKHSLGCRRGQIRGQAAVCDNDFRPAVSDIKGCPICWIGGIHRQIGAARLHDCQGPNQKGRRPPQMQTNDRIGSDALVAQQMGQRIGTGVELGVSQALAFKGQCFGIGCAGDLRLKRLMDAKVSGIILRGGVPVIKDALPFGLGQDSDRIAVRNLSGHMGQTLCHHLCRSGAGLARISGQCIPGHCQRCTNDMRGL